MREAADGDVVGTGGGVGGDRVQIDAAGDLHAGTAGDDLDRAGDVGRREVVEQDGLRTGIERFVELGEIVALDLYDDPLGRRLARAA